MPAVYLLLITIISLAGVLGCSGQTPATKTNLQDSKIMVRVSAGEFRIGTSPDQEAALADKFRLQVGLLSSESPQQTFALPEFYIDQTPVTNAEYKKFLDANPDRTAPLVDLAIARSFNWDKTARVFTAGNDALPVTIVTWHDANAYCQWAGKRLPTEAEWEKAARGADGRIWPWGNEWDSSNTNSAEAGKGGPTPVGQYPRGASPYAALDMVGNVWQWTSSLDQVYPYNATAGREDPNVPGMRVTRGGAWLFGAAIVRTATRNRFDPNQVSLSIGFRCAQ